MRGKKSVTELIMAYIQVLRKKGDWGSRGREGWLDMVGGGREGFRCMEEKDEGGGRTEGEKWG